jgi:hypothetical protein
MMVIWIWNRKPDHRIRRGVYALLLVGATVLLVGCRRENLVKEYMDELVLRWAPVHHQDVNPSGTWSLEGRSDFITAVDFDGDWNTANNWENISPEKGHLATGHAYYSILLTETHAFIIYAFYHPRDWDDMGNELHVHENDLEGLLAIIEHPGRLGSSGFNYKDKGVLKAIVTVFHIDFYSYCNRAIPETNWFVGNSEDIDGEISFEYWEGEGHPITAQESEGHGLKAWPHVKIEGGDGVVYFPSREMHTQPDSPNDRDNFYRLVDIFVENGLWDRRNNTETFVSYGVFNADDHQWGEAHAPWGWDDTGVAGQGADNVEAGVIVTDPVTLVKSYFGNLGIFSETYIYNPYKGVEFIWP